MQLTASFRQSLDRFVSNVLHIKTKIYVTYIIQLRIGLTLHPRRLTTSNCWQYLARHITALEVICLQPLLIQLLNFGQPLASASTPSSVILLHQLMLMCVNSGQPSLSNFNEKSVILTQLSKFSFCSLGQCLDNAWHVESVSFLQSFRLRSSIFGHIWAKVFIDPSAMDWQPRSDNWRRKPTHLREIFSIIGPW